MDIERLIDLHWNGVYRQLAQECGNREDAEDAMGEAVYAAIKAASQLEDEEHFQAWLAKIGIRCCMRIRKRGRLIQSASIDDLERKGLELESSEAGPVETAELSLLKRELYRAIRKLPTPYREVYVRRVVMGETADRVVDVLHISLPACKSRLRRARTMVREILGPYQETSDPRHPETRCRSAA